MHDLEIARMLETQTEILQHLARQDLKLERLTLQIALQNREIISLLQKLLRDQRHYPRPTGGRIEVT